MERRYWLYLFVIAFAVGTGWLAGFFIAQQYYGDLETRLQTLEIQYANSLKTGQEIKMDEVKLLISKSVEEVKDQYDVFLKIGLPFTIAALFASIFGAYRWAADMGKQKAEEAFKDPETLLKDSKRILVLTPDGENEAFLHSFFQLMGFNTPTFKRTSEIESIKSQHFDLAVLNVPSDAPRIVSAKNDLIEEITMAKSIFYFGLGQVSNTKLDQDGRLSYANAKSQLYGNLINAMKFQKML